MQSPTRKYVNPYWKTKNILQYGDVLNPELLCYLSGPFGQRVWPRVPPPVGDQVPSRRPAFWGPGQEGPQTDDQYGGEAPIHTV